MSVQVSYKKQFSLMILILFLFLIGIEGFSRLYEFFVPICDIVESDVFKNDFFTARMICYDTNLITYNLSRPLALEPNQYLNTMKLNSYGFRGDEINLIKDDNTYRIFVVGGSTVFGIGATSDRTTIPGYLQEFFNDEDLGKNIEVINAGAGHATSTQEKIMIKHMLIDFDPDLIIVYDGWNDANERKISKDVEIPENWQTVQNPRDTLKFGTYKIYRTPFVIYNIFFKQFEADNTFGVKEKRSTDEEILQVADQWKSNWIEVCNFGKQKNFQTVVILQPELKSGNKTLSPSESLIVYGQHQMDRLKTLNEMAKSLEEIQHFCDATFDLRTSFDNIHEPIFIDTVHMSDLGNEIIASKLYENILPIILEDISK